MSEETASAPHMQIQQAKWQPVMLVASRRLECACGALAIFVVLDQDGADDWEYQGWCQQCWAHDQEGQD